MRSSQRYGLDGHGGQLSKRVVPVTTIAEDHPWWLDSLTDETRARYDALKAQKPQGEPSGR